MDQDRDLIQKTLSSFFLYRPSLHSANQLRRTDYISLNAKHKALLPNYLQKLELVDDAIALNSKLVESMLRTGSQSFLNEEWTAQLRTTPLAGDMEKIRATVKQVVRDWGHEGASERELTYRPILELIEKEYQDVAVDKRRNISILTPGCGLGRLSFEIAKLGFDSIGNEFSYHMLIASNYLLNCTTQVDQYQIAPFVHSLSNHQSNELMLRRVSIPDVVPSDVLSNASFSMAAGEFVECFGDKDSQSKFDCIATCFFIDTAHNILQYIETIANLLKNGGLWINLGPCLWHHEHGQNRHGKSAFDDDGSYVGSIELSMEEVMHVVESCGFSIELRKKVSTPYMGNSEAMLEHIYHAQLFTARVTKSAD